VAFLPSDPSELLFGADFKFPFELTPEGGLREVVGEDNVMQALPIRAVTRRGAIAVYPDDGLDLDDLQNGVGTDVDRAVLKARVLSQYQREDRLVSLSVDVRDGENGPGDTLVSLHADLPNGKTVTPTVAFGGD